MDLAYVLFHIFTAIVSVELN